MPPYHAAVAAYTRPHPLSLQPPPAEMGRSVVTVLYELQTNIVAIDHGRSVPYCMSCQVFQGWEHTATGIATRRFQTAAAAILRNLLTI
jgi:hypothetical protein